MAERVRHHPPSGPPGVHLIRQCRPPHRALVTSLAGRGAEPTVAAMTSPALLRALRPRLCSTAGDLRARHVGAAGRSLGAAALRRARGRAAGGGAHRAGGQARPPRAGVGGAPGAAAARGLPGRARLAHRAAAGQRPRRHAAGRAQPHGHVVPAGGADRATTTTTASSPSPATWPPRAATVTVVTKDLPLRLKASIVGLDADEYRNELADDPSWTGFVELDVDGDVDRRAVRRPRRRPRRGPRPAVQHRRRPRGRHRSRRSGACTTTSGCTSCGATARCSTCTAARPSSASPSTCSPTPTSASCRSAVRPAPASRVLALAAGLDAVLEQRTPQAGHGVPADLRRRRPGPRLPARHRGREDEPVGGGGHRRPRGDRRPGGDRRGRSTATCSRCCRSPTSGAAASPTPS